MKKIILINIIVSYFIFSVVIIFSPLLIDLIKSGESVLPFNDKRSELPNYENVSWAKKHFLEFSELNTSYRAHIVWKRNDFNGETITIKNGYRRIIPNWEIFLSDHKKDNVSKLDKEILLQSIENNIKTLNINFFKKQLTKISANEIIQIVSRELAFSNIENQSLIEIQNCSKRINFLIKLIKNLLISNESQSLH